MSAITIIGAGVMGSAMSVPARDNGHDVRLVGTPLDRDIIARASQTGEHANLKRQLPDGISYFQIEELKTALADADLIISGVSSFGVDWFADEIIPALPEKIPVFSVTKGMAARRGGGLISYPGYYSEKYPGRVFTAVGGPCTSYELADRDQTHVCLCGNDREALLKIKKILGTDYYHMSLTNDVEGLECAVALKNAYALAVTLAVGICLKRDGVIRYNSQAALFGQSVREMTGLLKLFGCGADNIVYGAGDLYVTVFGGRTRKIGTLLGEGYTFGEAMKTLEGVTLESVVISTRVAGAVRRLIGQNRVSSEDFPLLLHVDDIINNGAAVDIPWDKFTTGN